jgi:ATP-dependent DNA helicase RecG
MGGIRGDYRQRQLFEDDPSLVRTKREDQWFDRKSFRIAPDALANAMIGFANADGGTILVGVENYGRITGVGTDPDHLNRLYQAAIDYSSPPVRHTPSLISCLDDEGSEAQVLVFEVHPSDQVHRSNRDEVYLRVGDQNRRLNF